MENVKNDLEITPKLFEYVLKSQNLDLFNLKKYRNENSSIDDDILQITEIQGYFFSFITKLIKPKSILELGTYKGFSAYVFAASSSKNTSILTCETDIEYAENAQKLWNKYNVSDKINLRVDKASHVLDSLISGEENNLFDLIFIDADKKNYIKYYEKGLKLLDKGGLMLIDNTLFFGTVIDNYIFNPNYNKFIDEEGVAAIKALNDQLKNDDRINVCLLPLSDGITLVSKK